MAALAQDVRGASNRGSGDFRLISCAYDRITRSFDVLITCDPDNLPSSKTIEKLGASFIDEVAVSPTEPGYRRGSRVKRRYRWTP